MLFLHRFPELELDCLTFSSLQVTMYSLNRTANSFRLLLAQGSGVSKFDIISRLVCAIFVIRSVYTVYETVSRHGIVGMLKHALESWRGRVSPEGTNPRIFKRVDQDTEAISDAMAQKLAIHVPDAKKNLRLPKEGWDFEKIEAELEDLRNLDHTRWEDGRVSGAVYHGGSELLEMQTKAIGKFSVSNPIHPDVFPGVRKMEAEIVAMVSEHCSRFF